MVVKQMEASNNFFYWIRTSRQNVLQAAMGTTRKKQTICVKCQFMTEIIVDIVALCILHKQMLVAFGHRMCMRDMSNNVKPFSNLL